MKKIVLLFAFLLLIGSGYAQTVRWMVAPEYASITHYSEDVFKCIDKNGKLQLLDWNGQSLLPKDLAERADAVTEYSDGYALVLQGRKILGLLPEAKPHSFQPVSGDYYATKYSFFSEGYIAVAKGSTEGKQGYLDTKGTPVLDCKYLEAMPVHKGWALVVEDGKDKVKPRRYKRTDNWSGNGMTMLASGESFVWATTFNEEGHALGKIKGGKYIVFDTKFVKKESDVNGNKDENKRLLVNSYDYSYNPEGYLEVHAPTNAQPAKDNHYSIYDEDGRKGYKNIEKEFVPAQFGAAEDFYARRAIVSMVNGYGIIELLDGKFAQNWSAEKIRVYEYANEVESLQFMLTAPASLDNSNLKLEFDKGDGRYVDCNGLHCDFKVADQVIDRKSQECTLRAKATYTDNGFPDLLLWEDSKKVYIDYISVGLSSPVVTSEYADENDNQTVKATVTNTSTIPVKVSATLNVAGRSTPFNGVLNPNQSQTLKVTVKVDNNKQVQATISAKVDNHNCGSKSAYVSLKKI